MIKPPLLLPRGVGFGPMIKWHHALPLAGIRDLRLAEYALADEHGSHKVGAHCYEFYAASIGLPLGSPDSERAAKPFDWPQPRLED
jgi:hypothetical protein